MIAASGANYGFRASAPHMLGICVGFSAMIVLIGGVGLSVIRNPAAITTLRWVGVVYLLWLAWKIAAADPAPPTTDPAEAAARGKPLTFLQAALFQWVNPKAWTVAAGALATYAAVGGENHALAPTLVLALLFGGVSLPIVMGWAILGIGAGRMLKSRQAMRRFNWTMAALLAASLIPTIIEGWRGDIAPYLFAG